MASRRKHRRRIVMLVTPQTAHNLQKLADMGGLQEIGQVVDKLTRDRMVQLHHFRKDEQEVRPIGFRF